MPKLNDNVNKKKKRKRPKFYYVYKIHFLCGYPSGRYYIGKRTYWGSEIKNDPYTGSGNFCKSYFKKYGEVSGVTYIKEILEINPSNKINLQREKILIGDLWKTDPLCMNMAPGGIGSEQRKGHTITPEETAKRIESFKKSKPFHKKRPPHSEETKRKLSIALKGNKNGTGHTMSPELKQKIKIAYGKPVYQFDLNGNFISKYKTIHEAAEAINVYPIQISNCCNGKFQSSSGYLWSFNNKPNVVYKFPGKTILQLDKNGNVVREFKSIADAGRFLGINPSTISCVLTGRIKTAGGFKWRYKNE